MWAWSNTMCSRFSLVRREFAEDFRARDTSWDPRIRTRFRASARRRTHRTQPLATARSVVVLRSLVLRWLERCPLQGVGRVRPGVGLAHANDQFAPSPRRERGRTRFQRSGSRCVPQPGSRRVGMHDLTRVENPYLCPTSSTRNGVGRARRSSEPEGVRMPF